MGFRGWPAEAVEFFEGLLADNTKTYWQANKATYDEKVHAPMAALLADLEPRWGAGKIFRPYRDVRFSADKTPYKTAIAAMLETGGYVQFSADGLAVGRGLWHPEPDVLQRYRAAVASERSGPALVKVVAELERKKIDVSSHDALKTVPRGFDKDHPRVELLKFKGVVARKSWPVAAWLGTTKAKARVEEFLADTEPLGKWLRTNVG